MRSARPKMDEAMSSPSRSTVWMRLQNELQRALPDFMKARRWFGGKTRTILSVEIADVIPIPNPAVAAAIVVARVNYLEGPSDTYTVPLLEEAPGGPQPRHDDNARIRVRDADGAEHIFSDALSNQAILEVLFDAIRDVAPFVGRGGRVGWRPRAFPRTAANRGSRKTRALAHESRAEQQLGALWPSVRSEVFPASGNGSQPGP